MTSGGAQCCCGQLIPPRRRRPACPRRRQGANRVPAGSQDVRRAGAALRRGPARKDAPARTALAAPRRRRSPAGPLLPAPPSGRLGSYGRPWPGRGCRRRAPAQVARPPARLAPRAQGTARRARRAPLLPLRRPLGSPGSTLEAAPIWGPAIKQAAPRAQQMEDARI